MIKSAGVSDFEELHVSEAPVSLLDVCPTIINAISSSNEYAFDGKDLFQEVPLPTDRRRDYYFYNKEDARGKHLVRMTRFRIESGQLINEGLVKSGEFQ